MSRRRPTTTWRCLPTRRRLPRPEEATHHLRLLARVVTRRRLLLRLEEVIQRLRRRVLSLDHFLLGAEGLDLRLQLPLGRDELLLLRLELLDLLVEPL